MKEHHKKAVHDHSLRTTLFTMRVLTTTGLILFSLRQLYAVILAIALPTAVPSQILNSLSTPNFTIPYNVNYSAISPSNNLPPDPSYESESILTVAFYDYGMPISNRDTIGCLAQLRRICMLHLPYFREPVETPQTITVGSVELHIDAGVELTWGLLITTEHLLGRWLERYESRTLKFSDWHDNLGLVATGILSRVGDERGFDGG